MTVTIDAPTFDDLYDVIHTSQGIEKVVRKHDQHVAVLVSHGFGAGWYSWNEEYPQLLFDPMTVKAVLVGEPLNDALREHFEAMGEYIYLGGYVDLRVHFVPKGTVFRIDEYDGNESMVKLEDDDIHIA